MNLDRMCDIDVMSLKERLNSMDDFLFLDVREPYEYQSSNLGAINIPLGSLLSRLNEIEQYKDKEVIVHCRSGQRSGLAKELMVAAGFSNVRNVLGGILEWQATMFDKDQ